MFVRRRKIHSACPKGLVDRAIGESMHQGALLGFEVLEVGPAAGAWRRRRQWTQLDQQGLVAALRVLRIADRRSAFGLFSSLLSSAGFEQKMKSQAANA